METDADRTAVQLMIVAGAIVLAPVMLCAVAAVIGPLVDADDGFAQMLRYGSIAVAVAIGMQTAALNMSFARKIEKTQTPQSKLAAIRARTIVILGGGEAAALVAGVVMLLTGPSVLLMPALGLFVVVVAVTFPTPGRVRQALAPGKDKYS